MHLNILKTVGTVGEKPGMMAPVARPAHGIPSLAIKSQVFCSSLESDISSLDHNSSLTDCMIYNSVIYMSV